MDQSKLAAIGTAFAGLSAAAHMAQAGYRIDCLIHCWVFLNEAVNGTGMSISAYA